MILARMMRVMVWCRELDADQRRMLMVCMTRIYAALFIFILCPAICFAQSVDRGEAACYRMEKEVNTLFTSFETSCSPVAGRQERALFLCVHSQ
jgi:hypothetical protein